MENLCFAVFSYLIGNDQINVGPVLRVDTHLECISLKLHLLVFLFLFIVVVSLPNVSLGNSVEHAIVEENGYLSHFAAFSRSEDEDFFDTAFIAYLFFFLIEVLFRLEK